MSYAHANAAYSQAPRGLEKKISESLRTQSAQVVRTAY